LRWRKGFYTVFLGVFCDFLRLTPIFKGLRRIAECDSATDLPVVPIRRSAAGWLKAQITGRIGTVPSPQGAYRDRHGRWARDAMDAFRAADETRVKRTAKPCGPDTSTLVSSRDNALHCAGDGDRKADHQESTKDPVKTIRVRECQVTERTRGD
jgi:hypothetical protein